MKELTDLILLTDRIIEQNERVLRRIADDQLERELDDVQHDFGP